MAKKNKLSTEGLKFKTEDVEEILKRKQLQNKMFVKMLKNATDEINSESKSIKINKK